MDPRIQDYLNYREFLRDFYLSKKNRMPEYSYRLFNSRGGIKSPSHLKMVIDGKRNLTDKTIAQYIKAINLKKGNEKSYFAYLVKYNQESDLDRKDELFQMLMEEKRKKGLTLIEQAQYNFLSQWHNVAIYVLLDLGNFEKYDESLLRLLKSKITKKDLIESFATLELLGLIKANEYGFYKQTSGAISTQDEIKSIAIHKYHKNMIELSLESLSQDDLGKREFNGVTLPISKERLPELKEKIRQFRKDVNALTSAFAKSDQVYQMNIQLFPLTEEL